MSQAKTLCILSSAQIHDGNTAGAARLRNIARALAYAGDQVFLFSSIDGTHVVDGPARQIQDRIFAVGTPSSRKRDWLSRKVRAVFNLVFESRFVLDAARRANRLRKEADVVFYLYPSTQISLNLASLVIIKSIFGFRLFCDVNEVMKFLPGNIVLEGSFFLKTEQWLRRSLAQLKYRLEEPLYRFYDGLVVISSNIDDYFSAYNNRRLRIPILADVAAVPTPVARAADPDAVFKIGFTGSIDLLKEGFAPFYEALSIVTSTFPAIGLHLYGPITRYQKELLLRTLPEQFGLSDKVVYHGVISNAELIKEIRSFDLLVIPRPESPQNHYGFSTKLSEYLISGVPVLVTDVSDNAMYIQDGVNGFVIPPNDVQAMSSKLLHIIAHRVELSPAVSLEGFRTAKKYFDFRNYGSVLHDFLFASERSSSV